MEKYTIGNVEILLDEIAAIGQEHNATANSYLIDIYLKGGQKVQASIMSKGIEAQGRKDSDGSHPEFLPRVRKEILDFRSAWDKYLNNVNSNT